MDSENLPRLKREGAAPKVGIVHLGPGAFFRAFNAIYTHDAMEAKGGDWGIAAVSLKSTAARDQLSPQGGVYTSVTLGPEAKEHRTIGSIADVFVARENTGEAIELMARPSIKIVSMTITEKGYGYDAATDGLDLNHPDIAHDLNAPDRPRSAVGLLVAALSARRRAGIPPFTILSCDNLQSNGHVIRTVLLEFARLVDVDLARWIDDTVACPATMVDRITPATTSADLAELGTATGYDDHAAVFHEPFRQWVVEDNFPLGRPAWETAGVEFVRSVESHETMKLRCLNGTHSALAYLGYLAGYETIAETVAYADFLLFCEKLWSEEIVPAVPPPEGSDLREYTRALLARYRNPNIQHRTWQIAMDGSQKLPQRILGTVGERLAKGQDVTGLCLVVAGWMRYVGGVDEQGQPIDVRDPLAEELRAASEQGQTPREKVAALLSMPQVFDPELARNQHFVTRVEDAYSRLCEEGSAAAVAHWIST